MRRLIVLLLFLFASVWFGLTIMQHPGYVFIVYQPWMMQMPLWFALIGLFVAFIFFYLLINSVDRLKFLWYRIKNWLRFRREHRSYSKTQHGQAALIEGRWKKAEHLLLAGVNQTIDPLMNYLGAATAAHELGAYDRRDHYIQTAYRIAPTADLAIGITQAELELKQDQLEHAAATLNHLLELSPNHPRVLALLEKVCVRSADWTRLQALIPGMRKSKLLTKEQSELFEKNLYCEMLRDNKLKTLESLQQVWNEMPRSAKKNPDVVHAYVEQLLRVGNASNEIEELIRSTLKSNWQPDLVSIYGTLPFNNLNRQLVIVGAWLNMYGPKPETLLTLGRLCVQVQLWGKAKDYFDKCLVLGPNPAASLEYGKLLEQLGEREEALKMYKSALEKI